MKWWMAHYQSVTPKRHYMYANSSFYSLLDLGPLRKIKTAKGRKQEPAKEKVVTVKHYRDKQGKKRWQGTDKLKGTERLEVISNGVLVSCLLLCLSPCSSPTQGIPDGLWAPRGGHHRRGEGQCTGATSVARSRATSFGNNPG